MKRIWDGLKRYEFAGNKPLTTLSSVSAYEKWAQNYPPHAHNLLMQTEESAMLDLLPSVANCDVLDLACGSGRYARIALERQAKNVVGVDNSLDMLMVGKNALPTPSPLQFILGSTEAIPVMTASIDIVICGLALGHIPQLDASLQEVARVLKTGAIALISDFHPFLFLHGKQRTFTASNGITYAVEHYAHLYSDYHQSAEKAGLTIDAIHEPRLPIDGVDVPAVIVYRLCRR